MFRWAKRRYQTVRTLLVACQTVHMNRHPEDPASAERPTGAPSPITIVEVAPRDGLQADPADLDTGQKVELILRAARAGIRRIETVSFVNPDRVPKMADADAVMTALHADGTMARLGANAIGLVLNRRGFDRAVDNGVDEVNAVVVCTDTFAQRNQGRDTAGLIEIASDICRAGRDAGLPVSVTLAASFGCPYEGEVSLDRLAWVLSEIVAADLRRSRWPTRSGWPCPPTCGPGSPWRTR